MRMNEVEHRNDNPLIVSRLNDEYRVVNGAGANLVLEKRYGRAWFEMMTRNKGGMRIWCETITKDPAKLDPICLKSEDGDYISCHH